MDVLQNTPSISQYAYHFWLSVLVVPLLRSFLAGLYLAR